MNKKRCIDRSANTSDIDQAICHLNDLAERKQIDLRLKEEELENIPIRYKIRGMMEEEADNLRSDVESVKSLITKLKSRS